ncbi:MAG TPA: RNA polymerase sigma factor [Thermoanaerobaculia bacterium]|nr:RNA polymerase sigma factor [Thermoanaerobaculia bacterium]
MMEVSLSLGAVGDKKAGLAVGAQSARLNQEEFDGFYRKTARPLWIYLARITGDGGIADDMLQKSYYRFLRSSLTTHDEKQLKSFLFQIATNLVRDSWRKPMREVELGDADHATVGPAAQVEMRHDLQRVFSQLRAEDRALLWLAHVDGSSHSEIATVLGVKDGSVKVMLHRARQKLAGLLRSKGLAPEVTR